MTIFRREGMREGEESLRDRPRFFDQVGYQTANASIGNKYLFTR